MDKPNPDSFSPTLSAGTPARSLWESGRLLKGIPRWGCGKVELLGCAWVAE